MTPSVERDSPPPGRGPAANGDERSFWFLLHDESETEALGELAGALAKRYPRLSLLFTAPQPALRAALLKRFPDANIVPPPADQRAAARRHLVKYNVRALLVLGGIARSDEAVIRAANDRAVPVAVASFGAAGDLPPGSQDLDLEHHFVASPAAEQRLAAAGVESDRITLLPAPGEARKAAFIEVAAQLLAQDLKLKRSGQRPFRRFIERSVLSLLSGKLSRRLLAAKARRLDSLEELRAELGHPRTILCLGNGPTSEDPAVKEVGHDCLFRVNDLWLKRGLLNRPDMVFTGSKQTLARVKGAIFGLFSIRSEARLLVAPLLLPATWGFRYATAERLGLFVAEPAWAGLRPTNGAVMLATAVALQPERLVIAGIDLFSHPAGSYPGDTTTPNAYSPGHNAEAELKILLEALSRYRGELVIISDALRQHWEAFQSSPPARQGSGETATL